MLCETSYKTKYSASWYPPGRWGFFRRIIRLVGLVYIFYNILLSYLRWCAEGHLLTRVTLVRCSPLGWLSLRIFTHLLLCHVDWLRLQPANTLMKHLKEKNAEKMAGRHSIRNYENPRWYSQFITRPLHKVINRSLTYSGGVDQLTLRYWNNISCV